MAHVISWIRGSSSTLFKSNWVYPVLALIILGAGFLRFYKLGEVPYGALIDELHFGYIAYSLLETGKDEHGIAWPLVFKGFGDYKLPLYAYGTMPFVAWLGPTVLSIRLLSALAGTALVGVSFLLLRRLRFSNEVSLFGALTVAVLPLTFILSRFGFESNLTLLVWTCGLVAFAQFFYTRQLPAYFLGVALFASTWYGYIAYRPVSVVILLIFIGILWRLRRIALTTVIITVALFCGIISPFFLNTTGYDSNTQRFKQIGVSADGGMVYAINEARTYCEEDLPRPICDVVWNKGTLTAHRLGHRFAKTISLDFMSLEGESKWLLDTEYNGIVYISTGLLVILGLFLFFRAGAPRQKLFLLTAICFTIASVPMILSGEPQRVRMSPTVPFVIIATAIGLESLLRELQHVKKSRKKLLHAVFWLVLLSAVAMEASTLCIDFFTVHTKKHDFGYKSFARDLMPYLHERADGSPIYFNNLFSDPVMVYAFYNQLDPQQYQDTVVLDAVEDSGFQHARQVANFNITNEQPKFNCQNPMPTNELYVTDGALPEEIKPEKIFYSQNGVLGYAYVYTLRSITEQHVLSCPQVPRDSVVQ